jgi:hypothetical protein
MIFAGVDGRRATLGTNHVFSGKTPGMPNLTWVMRKFLKMVLSREQVIAIWGHGNPQRAARRCGPTRPATMASPPIALDRTWRGCASMAVISGPAGAPYESAHRRRDRT